MGWVCRSHLFSVLSSKCFDLILFCVCVSEASKLVMSYVAAVCGKGQEVNKVKEQLLQSNPVLEGELAAFTLELHPSLWADRLKFTFSI